jgi:lysophospholipase L1-like esterase
MTAPSVLLLGDSHLTDQTWLGESGLGPRLRTAGLSVRSMAVPGLTASAAVDLYRGLQPTETWCVVSLGTNDAGLGVQPTAFGTDYRTLLDRLTGNNLVLLGPTPLDDALPASGDETAMLRHYDDVVAALAGEREAAHLSLLELLDPTRHLGLDGLHLNGRAYDVISAHVLETLAPWRGPIG